MHTKLNKRSAGILLFQSLFNFGNSFSALFVNIYLWRLKSNLETIASYNFCVYLTLMLCAVWCGRIVERRGEIFCLRTGVALYTLFYLTILTLSRHAGSFLVPLGILYGMGGAFLFMGFNTLISHQMINEERDFFLGALAAVAGLGAIVIQPVSGFIIHHFSGLQGYTIIFSLSLGLFLSAVGVTWFLQSSTDREVFQVRELWHSYVYSKRWRGVGVTMFISSMRGGIYSFLITILVYLAFKNEWGVGKYSMIMSAVALLAALMVGRALTEGKRVRFYFFGVTLSLAAGLILVVWSAPVGFILYGLLYNASVSMRDIPNNTISYEVIDELNRNRGMRFTYVIGREIPIGLGRLTGLFLFMVLYRYLQSDWVVKILIPAIAAFELTNVLVFRWIKRTPVQPERLINAA